MSMLLGITVSVRPRVQGGAAQGLGAPARMGCVSRDWLWVPEHLRRRLCRGTGKECSGDIGHLQVLFDRRLSRTRSMGSGREWSSAWFVPSLGESPDRIRLEDDRYR